MRLEYTSLIARRQTLPSAVGCSVMLVSQVRSGAVAAASVDQVRCWERKRAALFFPALTPRAGSSSAMNPYPNEPTICLAMRQS